MIVIPFMYLLLGINLVNVISEKSTTFYRDIRFWLILVSFITLVWMTLESYPM